MTARAQQTLAHYEAALRLMQEGKYDKAHAAFDKMLATGAGDLADRIRMYINACLLQVAQGQDQLQEQRRALRLCRLAVERWPL